MALSAPSWRLPIRCLANAPVRRAPIAHYQRRTAASNSNSSDSGSSSNPVLEEYLRNNPQEAETSSAGKAQLPEGVGQAGDIANSSIFEDDRRAQKQADREAKTDEDDGTTHVGGIQRDPRNMAHVLDPNPAAREHWEKRQIIKMIRKNGRLSKEQFIKRTEREHLVRSHNMKTSVKKLGMLARQIAGKTIDDAITQMRFSKKKVAQEVLKQLEFARDEAVVMRGMGLGNAAREDGQEDFNASSSSVTGTTSQALEETRAREKSDTRPVDIQLKNGSRHTVADRSKIYIDQAWVGRGPYGKLPDFRARGQIFMMRTPWTSLSVVLKEEATRVREWEQREAKRQRQLKDKAWKALPDRPIQIQRQWYSW